MNRDIVIKDMFGEERFVGLRLTMDESDGELYEVLAIKEDIVLSPAALRNLEGQLNVDKREGYAIYPIRNSLGDLVWFWRAKNLVLCLARGLWG